MKACKSVTSRTRRVSMPTACESERTPSGGTGTVCQPRPSGSTPVAQGAQTSRPFGFASELLPRYAWYQENSTDRAWPGGSLMPNDLGLFDMLGNVYEWCHDVYRDYPPWARGRIVEDVDTSTSIDALAIRNLRGLTFHSFHAGVRSASRNNDEP